MTEKQIDANNNRTIFIAKQFIPKESIKLYYAELCKCCKCDNDTEEYLACCWCQDGSLYEEKTL